MKEGIITMLSLLMFAKIAVAQECKTVFYFSPGREVVFNKYDKDGKSVGKEVGTVSNVVNENGKVTSDYRLIKYEADGKVKEDGSAKIVCNNEGLRISFQVPNMKNGTSSEGYFSYPNDMKPGQKLESKMEMNINGVVNGKKTNVYFKVENRKVLAIESVKAFPGNYNAVKIEYDMMIRIKVLGIGIPMNIRILEWYSPGFGIVKAETYNKKSGELMETSILSSIE